VVRETPPKTWTAAELGSRWEYHPSSVVRVMRRFGFSGMKFGPSKQAARRFADADVKTVERIAALQIHTTGEIERGSGGAEREP